MTKQEALGIVLEALENLNQELDEPIPVGEDTPLFGADALIDSLSLVSVIVDVEAAASDALGFPVSLTDDRAINRETSPFTNPGTLADYIVLVAAEKS
jgi:acyl carrier protein